MFKEYVYEKNGDVYTKIPTFRCDITGETILESDGWYGNANIHISDKGVENLIEKWIDRHRGSAPFILHYLLNRLLITKKRSTYINKKLKSEILKKYKHKCNYCGSVENLEIDHIKPVAKGGLTEASNLQILCKSCNTSKGAKYEIFST